MSDEAASQYKNRKNFASLCKFKTKYNVDAEWHFFATSHGKAPCDAIGGILNRMAGNASLAKEHEHPITSAKELYDCNKNSSKMSFSWVSYEEYMKQYFQENYNNSCHTKVLLFCSDFRK